MSPWCIFNLSLCPVTFITALIVIPFQDCSKLVGNITVHFVTIDLFTNNLQWHLKLYQSTNSRIYGNGLTMIAKHQQSIVTSVSLLMAKSIQLIDAFWKRFRLPLMWSSALHRKIMPIMKQLLKESARMYLGSCWTWYTPEKLIWNLIISVKSAYYIVEMRTTSILLKAQLINRYHFSFTDD